MLVTPPSLDSVIGVSFMVAVFDEWVILYTHSLLLINISASFMAAVFNL